MTPLAIFIHGLNSAGCLVATVFFFRFWRRTADVLFLAFGIAFLLFAVNQAAVALSSVPRESQSWLYLLRLLGFVVIAAAILQRNLQQRH